MGNIPRTLLMVPTWAYAKAPDGVFVNLYIGSTITLEDAGGTDIEMVQQTDYPWSGRIAITVNPRLSRRFSGLAERARQQPDGRPDQAGGGDLRPTRRLVRRHRLCAGDGGRFGTSGWDQLRGPGLVNLDLSVYRALRITERFGLQFRAESFNAANTPHFGNPRSDMSSSQPGVITGVQNTGREGIDERMFRYGLRLSS